MLSNIPKGFGETDGSTKEIATTLLKNQLIAESAKKILAKQIVIPKIPTPIPIVNVVMMALTIMDVISILNKKKKEQQQLEAQVAAANAEQEELVYRRTQAIQQLKSQLDAEFFRIEEQVVMEIDRIIDEVFNQYIAQLEDELQLKKADSARIHDCLSLVDKLYQNIMNIKLQIVL